MHVITFTFVLMPGTEELDIQQLLCNMLKPLECVIISRNIKWLVIPLLNKDFYRGENFWSKKPKNDRIEYPITMK